MFRKTCLIFLLMLIFSTHAFAEAAFSKSAASVQTSSQFTRVDKTFVSHGDKLKAWLYLPAGVSKPPIVVMAHGFGGQRWMRLPAYAEHFAKMGMAVFIFDYRGFNDSEGKPRNYVNPKRHLQDWEAAIDYVKTLDTVDAKRMALWGTSFSGGHVIVEAAKHPEIKAVVSQVPFTDGMSTNWYYMKNTPMFAVKGFFHGMGDVFASLVGKRHNVRVAGRPGEAFAMMCQPDTMAGLMKLIDGVNEKDFEKDNFCPANIVLTMGFYRPISYAKKVACISMPMNHFDPYVGEPFEKLVVIMGDFLKANLN